MNLVHIIKFDDLINNLKNPCLLDLRILKYFLNASNYVGSFKVATKHKFKNLCDLKEKELQDQTFSNRKCECVNPQKHQESVR